MPGHLLIEVNHFHLVSACSNRRGHVTTLSGTWFWTVPISHNSVRGTSRGTEGKARSESKGCVIAVFQLHRWISSCKAGFGALVTTPECLVCFFTIYLSRYVGVSSYDTTEQVLISDRLRLAPPCAVAWEQVPCLFLQASHITFL